MGTGDIGQKWQIEWVGHGTDIGQTGDYWAMWVTLEHLDREKCGKTPDSFWGDILTATGYIEVLLGRTCLFTSLRCCKDWNYLVTCSRKKHSCTGEWLVLSCLDRKLYFNRKGHESRQEWRTRPFGQCPKQRRFSPWWLPIIKMWNTNATKQI